MIEVKPATLEDLAIVSAILKEAADRLRDTGRPMWRDDELEPIRINEDVKASLFHLAYLKGEPAGTIKSNSKILDFGRIFLGPMRPTFTESP